MVATPLAATNRYFVPGVRHYYWVPAIANTAAPTRAELNAGTDLTGQIATVTGFTLTANTSDVTPLGSQTVILLPTTIDPSGGGNEIILYASANSSDVRTVMPAGSTGFLVFLYEGDVTGQLCEVWPAVVNVMFLEQDATIPGEIHLQFTITSAPSQNVPIP